MGVLKEKESGQALLEFALVLPIFLLLLIGILNFGEVLAADLLLQNIDRNAARSASLGDSEQQVETQITNEINSSWFLSSIGCDSSTNNCPNATPYSISPQPDTPTAGVTTSTWSSQTSINVQLHYGVQLWGPISTAVLGNPFVLNTSVTMIAE